jgi:glucose-6-phosphate isomerase
MPVLAALLGILNINGFHYNTQAIIPYDDALFLLPSYLQQLEMESNGKRSNDPTLATAPIIWGGVGCDAQHAYMQLLHQGTSIVPIDFWVATEGHPHFQTHQLALVANCLMQSKALMEGTQTDLSILPDSVHYCGGNRPSNTLMYKRLTPQILGSLIALYEHKVFVQGVIWGINSFDQWGVELGKQWVKKILPILHNDTKNTSVVLDSSTQGLLDYFRAPSPPPVL